VTLCTDLTEANEAIDALTGATPVAASAAKSFASRMFSRGVSKVKVRGLVPGGFADWSDGGVCLRYEGAAVTAHYYAFRDGREEVNAVAEHDNGHDGTMNLPVRGYGLIAAMLLART
jgi:hypothetical protein